MGGGVRRSRASAVVYSGEGVAARAIRLVAVPLPINSRVMLMACIPRSPLPERPPSPDASTDMEEKWLYERLFGKDHISHGWCLRVFTVVVGRWQQALEEGDACWEGGRQGDGQQLDDGVLLVGDADLGVEHLD